MLRLAFDFIITWRETRTRPNAYANLNNYLKTRRKKNGKVTTYYIALQKLAY